MRAGRIVGAVAGVLAIGALAIPVGGAEVASAQASGPAVEATPLDGLTDGLAVKITVRTTAAHPISAVEVLQCRAGVTYGASTEDRPNADAAIGGPNCPPQVSTSADSGVILQNPARVTRPDGHSFFFKVGETGLVKWKALPDYVETSLTCDESHPCSLVVQLKLREGPTDIWRPQVFELKFGASNPLAGCGGAAEGALNSGGSDRMSDAWIKWTVAECVKPGRKGAAARASFVGEGEAVEQFNRRVLDVVYTAGGNDEAMGLVAADGERRAAVPVPIALNGAVVAIAGQAKESGELVPYRDLELTLEEVALMFSGGGKFATELNGMVLPHNEMLRQSGESIFNTSGGFDIGARTDADAPSWYFTRWLRQLAPQAWVVPDHPRSLPADRGKPRGVHAALGAADPTFLGSVALITGRPSIAKALANFNPGPGGGVWVLTDLATAEAFGMTPVRIQNKDKTYVAPTPESMRAAVKTMKPDSEGILISDAEAVAAPGEVQPYPLTFVEYALAPAEPLVQETNCTARSSSQALMNIWLEHMTGAGQGQLPRGLVTLPPELAAQTAPAIAKVGKSETSGTCLGKVKTGEPATTTTSIPAVVADPPPTPPTAPTPESPAAPSSTDSSGTPAASGSGSSGSVGGSSSPVAPVAAPPAAGAPAPAVLATDSQADVPIPEFGGRKAASMVGTFLALIGIVAVSSGATIRTARARNDSDILELDAIDRE